jgi:hemolysin activation/secretion protein
MRKMLKNINSFRSLFLILVAVATQPTISNAQEQAQYSLVGVNEFEASSLLQYAAHAALDQGDISGENIARIVEQLYHEDGYFLARTRFDSDLQAIFVNEGQISSLHVEGVDAEMFALIRSYAAPLLTDPAISHAELERVLMLVRDIETITAVAELVTSPEDGTTQMRIIAEEHLSNWGRLTLDTPSREIGDAISISLEQNYYHILTAGDLLRLNLEGTSNLENGNDKFLGSIAYRTPAGPAGGYIEAYAGSYTARHDARGALSRVDSSGSTAILAYGLPTLRTADRYGYVIGELRYAQTDIDSPLVNSDESAVVGSLIWIDGRITPNGNALEYAVSLSAGQQSGDPASANSFQYARFGLGWSSSAPINQREIDIDLQLLGQLSNDVLPGSENFVMGGHNINRGYDYGELAGDNGVFISGEISSADAIGLGRDLAMVPFAFAEVGWVSSNSISERFGRSEEGASIGIGFDFSWSNRLSGRFHTAMPLADGPISRDDPALYLAISRTW